MMRAKCSGAKVGMLGYSTFYMVMIFTPVVTSSVAVALIWQQIFRKDGLLSRTIAAIAPVEPPN